MIATEEGRVFHRRTGPLQTVRAVTSIDSRPNEQFAFAEVSRLVNSRNRVLADVVVPPNGLSALVTVSRPFFPGYRARLGNQLLKVDSYRGLMPIIEIPAGLSGRLTLAYRPWWLVFGGAVSATSLLVLISSAAFALSTARRQ